MPSDTTTRRPKRPRRNRFTFPQSPVPAERNLDTLAAELIFGAYWHAAYYRDLPGELRGWGSALTIGRSQPGGGRQ
jgi:hypothetical protein